MSDGVEQEQRVSRAAGIRVREADLGSRALIGSGAATEVHRLDAFTVPGHQGGLAFVRARDRSTPHWDPAILSRLVALRWGLEARERALLDSVAAWPLAVVEGDDGEVVGCLVPLAAHPFYYLPADEPGSGKVTQNAKWLVVAPKRARRAGAVAVGERDAVARVTVLARVCLLLELVHRRGVVFGDLSERSVLFGVGGYDGSVGDGGVGDGGTGAGMGAVAEAFVVGCDGAAFAGEGTVQRNSAGWAVPSTFDVADEGDGHPEVSMSREPSVQTVETDRYKLGLLILRVLAPAGDGLERSRDASRVDAVLDETGQRMMRAALGEDAAGRPSASDWYAYLRGVLMANLSAPVLRRVSVSPALVAEGDEVRLEVEVDGAQELVIEMPGRADIRREVGGRVVLERFTARQSGRIGVRASNAHGSVGAVTEVVRVLPVPSPARIAVAAPEVPSSLGVVPDLAPLEAAMGISLAPVSGGDAGSGSGSAPPSPSPFERMARLKADLDADALPLRDVLRIGVEAERVSRERMFPSFEEFLGDITSSRGRDDKPSS
ncbi:hypothetical protein [Herbiconiux liangxiaofengii]|uniref:hypothetical protein n=1 Tax=Herbiconiux liangxiaofengii TaxID=3342795 RepID=UPI0035B786B2